MYKGISMSTRNKIPNVVANPSGIRNMNKSLVLWHTNACYNTTYNSKVSSESFGSPWQCARKKCQVPGRNALQTDIHWWFGIRKSLVRHKANGIWAVFLNTTETRDYYINYRRALAVREWAEPLHTATQAELVAELLIVNRVLSDSRTISFMCLPKQFQPRQAHHNKETEYFVAEASRQYYQTCRRRTDTPR